MTPMTAELETSDEVEVITAPGPATLADHLEGLGNVDTSRVLWTPRPGTATEADLTACGVKLVELIDGTLVRKPMGLRESLMAVAIAVILDAWRSRTNAGVVGGPDGEHRLEPGMVRKPDVSYTAWESLPNDTAHLQPIGDYAPDLAVEVLSESNRAGSMGRKIREYFTHGTKLVWVVNPRACTIAVYTDPTNSTILTRADTLVGSEVLPGFSVPLAELFDNPQLNPRPQRGA